MNTTTAPRIIGHRGAQGDVAGNTQASFEWALKHHVSEIETDCRLTSDGVIVQFHDPAFKDKSGRKHLIKDTSYKKLKHFFPEIMTLDELIVFVDKKARLMIEIKPRVPTKPIIETIRAYLAKGWRPSDFSFASFDLQVLKQMHAALPEIERIVLESWLAIRALHRAKQLDTRNLSMNQQYLWWGFILWATRHNHKIYTYPSAGAKHPNFNHKKPERWAKYGLYGIITDRPEIFE